MKILPITVLYLLILNNYRISGQINNTNVKGGLDVKDIIEKFLNDLHSNIPEVFTFTDRNLTMPNNRYIKGTFNYTDVSLTGLKEFNATVTYRSFLPFPKAFLLILENLCLNFTYKSNLTLLDSKYLQFFGEGNASVNLRNLLFGGNVSVSILPVNASTSLDVDLDIVLVNITGLLNDENFSSNFGSFLGKTVTKIFDVNKKLLSKTLTNTLNFILQQVLKHQHYFIVNKNETQEKNVLYSSPNIFTNSLK